MENDAELEVWNQSALETVKERFNEINNKSMDILEDYVTGGYLKTL